MKIVIPGKPISQQRHRFRQLKNGKVWAYDPIAREKAIIKRCISQQIINDYPDFELIKMADIGFLFYLPIPKSMRKKEREYANKEMLRHNTKPDVDNLVKGYLDCLPGIVIADDRDISLIMALKLYSQEPRVEIYIKKGKEILDKTPHDSHDSLICDEPQSVTKDVHPYSTHPFHRDQ